MTLTDAEKLFIDANKKILSKIFSKELRTCRDAFEKMDASDPMIGVTLLYTQWIKGLLVEIGVVEGIEKPNKKEKKRTFI